MTMMETYVIGFMSNKELYVEDKDFGEWYRCARTQQSVIKVSCWISSSRITKSRLR
jgi:hypothetical protein